MKGEYHEACSTCGGGRICPDPWARSHAADFSRRSRRDVHAGSNAEPGLLLDDVFDGHVVVHADAARQAAAPTSPPKSATRRHRVARREPMRNATWRRA